MVRYFLKFLELFFRAMVAFITLFLLFCMNVFTIPLFILLWLPCKIFKRTTPHWRRYGTMFYPSWSYAKESSFTEDEIKTKRKTDRSVKKHKPIRAWEERFF